MNRDIAGYQYDMVGREVATWRDEQGGKGERFYYATTNQLTNVRYNAEQVWTANPVNWGRWVDYGYQPGMLNRWWLVDNGNFSWVSAGHLNQYTSVGGQTLEYDARFNLKSYAGATFTYNAQNQLISGSKGTNTVQFVYDGLGRCLKRITNGAGIIFAYDGWKPLAE
jgi:YD repeat-containing protein